MSNNCGKLGHKMKDCRNLEKGPKCFKCNGFGHIASKCQKVESKVEPKKSMQVAEKPSKDRMFKNIEVNGVQLQALIDTGSDVNLIRAEDYFKLGSPRIARAITELKGLGSKIKTLGYFEAEVNIDGSTYPTKIHVVPQDSMTMSFVVGGELLSQTTLVITKDEVQVFKIEIEEDNKIATDCTNKKYVDEIKKLVDEYNPKEPKTTNVTTKIILKDEVPIHQPPRRLSPKEDEEVERQIEEWLEKKIVRPSTSEYSSPIVLVKKKNGSTRICVDYRKLNKHVVKDRYPLPVIEDQIDKLQGAKIFSTLDLKNGFFHVPVEESSIKYTAFVTPRGHYEFLKTPFGYCNSPLSFQRYINHIFRDAIREGILLIYLDDLIILAKDEEEALRRLKMILKIAEDHGLQLNWQKCSFLCQTIEYLGYEISEGKIKPIKTKINAVASFPEPKSIKQVQSFLGLSGYFRKFIPNYASIARPLTDLLKKEANFKFGIEERISFNALKKALSEQPVLRIYDPHALTELHTDASKYGLGAILMQRDDQDGKMHPVYYYSKKTKDAEQRYTSYELEVLAIITALKKFRVYLYGIQFKIITDCAAFQMTMSKKELTTRIARWALFLEDYRYTIEHRAGTRMKHVDALSRNPITMMITRGMITQIEQAQKADRNLRPIVQLIEETGNYENYLIERGVLYKEQEGRKLLVLPKGMQMEVIGKMHVDNGHFATKKTQELIEREFWFPDMKKKIEHYVANCIPCIMAERKRGRKECLLRPIEKGDCPLETYHVDHLGPLATTKKNYKHLLVVVDGFTKFVWIYPVKSTTSEETITKLEAQASIFGNPKRIISDRGTAFTANAFKQYCDENNIEHLTITTGVPRGNGQVERIIRTIIPVLTKLSLENPNDWFKYTTGLQRILNSTFQRSIGRTPFEMLVGAKMRTPEQITILEALEEEMAEIYNDDRERIREEAKANLIKIQEENKRNFDKGRKPARKYKVGEAVAIKRTQFRTQSKLLPKFLGPYQIIKSKNNDRYDLLKVGDGEGPRHTSSSADLMKPWADPDYSSESDEEQDGRVCRESSPASVFPLHCKRASHPSRDEK